MCLPNDPLFVNDITGGHRATMHGAEYEIPPGVLNSMHNHDVPCVVCMTPRTNVLMIPGRNQCYNGWQLEYNGLLVAPYFAQASSKVFICMDSDPEALSAGTQNMDGALLHLVEAKCGALKCPPYIMNREITCAVCSYIG